MRMRLERTAYPVPLDWGKGSDNCAAKQKTRSTPDYQGLSARLGSEPGALPRLKAAVAHKGRPGTRSAPSSPSRTQSPAV